MEGEGGVFMDQDFTKTGKKFGFGFMRLPRQGDEIDFKECSRMVDAFMDAGFTYFDTAKGYHSGQSEVAIRECVVKRYPRDSFTLADKLSPEFFKSEEDIRRVFEEQLQTCGVTYFDFYLMHAQGRGNYEQYQKCRAYEIAQELKAEGKIRHVGLSFHDNGAFLDKILTEHPEVEFVQIQFNYLDYADPGVQSKRCMEVCKKHGKPVVIMEPVKGGRLVNLPKEADDILRKMGNGSNASYAIRFAASFPEVFMVLSGMSNFEQMEDNISFMKEFVPFTEEEYNAVKEVRRLLMKQNLISCTACRYCVDGCPQNISIPELFADFNGKTQEEDWDGVGSYKKHTENHGKASDCIKCGKCRESCPQHLDVPNLLKKVTRAFE